MTSVLLVDSGGTVVEYVTAEEEDSQQVGQTRARVTLHAGSHKSSVLFFVFLPLYVVMYSC